MIRFTKTEVLTFTIEGNLPRKSNSRQKTASGKYIKSKAALEYSKSFGDQIRPEWQQMISLPCRLEAACYYRNKLSDLSDELLADLCEAYYIIANDNLFREKELVWLHDPVRPRVEVTIYLLEDYPTKWLRKITPKSPSPSVLPPPRKASPAKTLKKRQLELMNEMKLSEKNRSGRIPRMTSDQVEELLTKKETFRESKKPRS
jgi:hypothetical protein